MPKHLQLAAHLSVEQLAQRYRQAADPVARSHWQILWLLAGGRRVVEVCAVTGYSDRWVREVAHRYNAAGPTGVGDRRHANPGARRLVAPELEAELERALDGPSPDGGLWNSRKVADWLGARLGRPVHPARGWEVLRRLEYGAGRPRPHHARADPDAQAAFKGGAWPSR